MDTNKILLGSFIGFVMFLLFVAIITMSYFARQRQILTNYAIDPAVEKMYGEFKTDEIIVKFKEPIHENITLDYVQREATKEATPVGQLLEMVGLGEPSAIPSSLEQLNEQFPVADIQQTFPLVQNVQGAASDKAPVSSSNPFNSVYTISFESDVPVVQLVQQLSRRSDIEYVEPNYIVKIQSIPNDSNFSLQWGMHNTGTLGGTADADIDAPEAWDDITNDTREVIVAVLDTGVDTGHEDLSNRIWRNTDEPVFDGRDDDNNGFVDDVHGWNFLNSNYNISDSQGHGTHVSGVIGAQRDNGKGIAGVADKVKIMPVKFLDTNGVGTLQDAARGIIYATENGADVINCSFGVFTSVPPQTLYQAIDYARTQNVMIVTATGNEGVEIGKTGTQMYPANFELNNIITVAATTAGDRLSSFSNYSAIYADLAAPGSDIFSTLPNNRYQTKSGTSMATPFVSGAVAVAMSHFPTASSDQIREILLNSVDKISHLSGKVVTGGRLNLDKVVASIPVTTPTVTPITTVFITPTLSPTLEPSVSVSPTISVSATLTPSVTPPLPSVYPTPPADCWIHEFGDADCDNNVTILDYVCWSQALVTGQLPGRCYSPDFDSNGRVDVLDYAIWLHIFLYAVG